MRGNYDNLYALLKVGQVKFLNGISSIVLRYYLIIGKWGFFFFCFL